MRAANRRCGVIARCKPHGAIFRGRPWRRGALIALLQGAVLAAEPGAGPRPLLRDFIGINAHFHFRPELYAPVAMRARSYHNMNWDVAAPGDPITIPHCANKVDWTAVYGPWQQRGIAISLCVQFDQFGPRRPDYRVLWEDREGWAEAYGEALARFFGPTHGNGMIEAIEIGNEPGREFDDALYRRLFAAMAHGIRRADPKLMIVTCAAHAAPANPYSKSLDETFGDPALHPLFDAISVHTYAELPEKERAHPWQRTFPEDPRSPFLSSVDAVLAWRDRHAPGRQVWVTEFGWDSCTPEALARREGWFKKLGWTGVSDEQQARYLVRALLLFAARAVDRAVIYYFNDDDRPSVHGASGLTRHFNPKPAYHAVRQLQELLGDARFHRVAHQAAGVHILAFRRDDGREAWAVWADERAREDAARAAFSRHFAPPRRWASARRLALAAGEGVPFPTDAPPPLSGDVIYYLPADW